jgi:hypothetical protein
LFSLIPARWHKKSQRLLAFCCTGWSGFDHIHDAGNHLLAQRRQIVFL